MRIAFWGTPEFAVGPLQALAEAGHHIALVITRPDRPAGRGRRVNPPAVKVAAAQLGFPVVQPRSPSEAGFLAKLVEARPELSVVVAYGHLLPRRVLDAPGRGSVNLHASLLPRLRGAAPVAWAVLRGQGKTGVTVMRMEEEMDAGPVLHSVSTDVGVDESATELSARLARLGARALVEALARMEAGAVREVEQDHSRATFAPKISRVNARISWKRGAVEIARLTRAMDSPPGAWAELRGEPVKLFRPVPNPENPNEAVPGTVLSADPDAGLVVAVGDGTAGFLEVQPPGRRRMSARAWIAGRGVAVGERFT